MGFRRSGDLVFFHVWWFHRFLFFTWELPHRWFIVGVRRDSSSFCVPSIDGMAAAAAADAVAVMRVKIDSDVTF